MKRFSILLLMTFFGLSAFAQENILEFVQKKTTPEGFVIYFDVIGINGDDHANAILEDFLADENVQRGRYFISSANKDRYQLYVNNTVTPNYVLGILKTHGVDFDYTSVSVNGYIQPDDNKSTPNSATSTRTDVQYPSFPKYVDTGNPLQDQQRYADEKSKWIDEHPDEYEKMLNGQVAPNEND
ncbi:MAG: hypothetical protein KBB11_06915 [Bacteroidales bacterium]|nr:hypothetical protein [Bacteroidales bacterium]